MVSVTNPEKQKHANPFKNSKSGWALTGTQLLAAKKKRLHMQSRAWHTNTIHKRPATKQRAPKLCACCQMWERRACVCWRLMDSLVEVNHTAVAPLHEKDRTTQTQTESAEDYKEDANCVIHYSVTLFYYQPLILMIGCYRSMQNNCMFLTLLRFQRDSSTQNQKYTRFLKLVVPHI